MLKTKFRTLGPPVRITELLQLTHLRIPLEHITWARVTMTSNQWICIRHGGSVSKKNWKGGTAITILNPHNSSPQTWQAITSSAKMNPEKPIIALRADSRFQVYDLRTRKCSHRCHLDYDIQFWTWINSSIIAVVSNCVVYHWNLSLENGVLPEKVFTRDARMDKAQLIHYTSDAKLKWFALTGLFVEDNRVVGLTQVFSADRNLCQTIEAHCVHFAYYRFKGNSHPTCVLVAASRGTDTNGKLHVVQLGPHVIGNSAATSHSEAIEFSDLWCNYDFPSSIQVSSKIGLVYLTTKYGRLYIFDLETSAKLCSLNICPDVIFTTAFNQETEGIIAIARNGQVLSIDLKKEQLVDYVWEVSKRTHIAERLLNVLKDDSVQL